MPGGALALHQVRFKKDFEVDADSFQHQPDVSPPPPFYRDFLFGACIFDLFGCIGYAVADFVRGFLEQNTGVSNPLFIVLGFATLGGAVFFFLSLDQAYTPVYCWPHLAAEYVNILCCAIYATTSILYLFQSPQSVVIADIVVISETIAATLFFVDGCLYMKAWCVDNPDEYAGHDHDDDHHDEGMALGQVRRLRVPSIDLGGGHHAEPHLAHPNDDDEYQHQHTAANPSQHHEQQQQKHLDISEDLAGKPIPLRPLDQLFTASEPKSTDTLPSSSQPHDPSPIQHVDHQPPTHPHHEVHTRERQDSLGADDHHLFEIKALQPKPANPLKLFRPHQQQVDMPDLCCLSGQASPDDHAPFRCCAPCIRVCPAACECRLICRPASCRDADYQEALWYILPGFVYMMAGWAGLLAHFTYYRDAVYGAAPTHPVVVDTIFHLPATECYSNIYYGANSLPLQCRNSASFFNISCRLPTGVTCWQSEVHLNPLCQEAPKYCDAPFGPWMTDSHSSLIVGNQTCAHVFPYSSPPCNQPGLFPAITVPAIECHQSLFGTYSSPPCNDPIINSSSFSTILQSWPNTTITNITVLQSDVHPPTIGQLLALRMSSRWYLIGDIMFVIDSLIALYAWRVYARQREEEYLENVTGKQLHALHVMDVLSPINSPATSPR